jgi:hypothetical protein
MMKRITFALTSILMISIIMISCTSQESMKQNVEKQFAEMSDAFLKGNVPVYVDFMYPRIIERAGGRDSTIKLINLMIRGLNEQGREIKSINYGNISDIVKAGKELHCIVSQTLELRRADGTEILETSVMAVSGDKGKTWKFLEVSGVNIQSLKQIFPDYNEDLKIPDKKSPTFIPDNMQKNPK